MLDQIFQYDANATPTLAILSKRAPQACLEARSTSTSKTSRCP
jgi:hypothetical protein